ncbi:MAG: hypothetical protein U9O94_00215, partial [Nanoarchaeota archaeon]|nr:hypothetical protein [Nanoarchaeota archaeon]
GDKEEKKEDSKEEGAKEDKSKEENVEEEKKEDNAEEDGLAEINKTIAEAHGDIKNGNIVEAKSKYAKVIESYKTIPKEHKKEVFNECIKIQKELVGK